MNRKLAISITLIVILIITFTIQVTAAEYKHTTTSFRYIGDIFHEKEMSYYGGSGSFYVHGFGEASGTHDAHTVLFPDGDSTINVRVNMRGKTDADYARTIAQREAEVLAHVKARREEAIARLNELKKATPGMTGEEYAAEMRAINAYFDELVAEIIESYQEAKKNIRILNETILNDASVRIGLDMDPGESGFINHSVASYQGSDRYLRIDSFFENTGGATKRSLRVDGFIRESMHVEGYAKVWESSTLQDGRETTGWWDMRP